MEIRLPALTAYQKEVHDYMADAHKNGKIAVIKSIRQSGKTFFCVCLLAETALRYPGCTSAVIEPTLSQSRNVFNTLVKAFKHTNLITQANASLLSIAFSNGSEIIFKSTEQGEGNRSFTVSGVLILDEAAYLPDEGIYTILPFVNAHNAPIVVCSTPFMQEGYFYDMVKMATEKPSDKLRFFDWAKHSEIGRFLDDERKEFYRQTMSRNKYTTEVLGEFLSSDGLLFTNIEACVVDEAPQATTLYMGIDFATGGGGDYSVLSVFNERAQMVGLHYTNNLPPMQQVEWLSNLINDYGKAHKIHRIYAEENSIGKVYVDALRSRIIGARVTPFVTTNESKQEIVTEMQIALEQERVQLLRDSRLLDEMRRFEATINPKTKKISYGGHIGTHDDCVMATLIAYHAYNDSHKIGNYKISFR